MGRAKILNASLAALIAVTAIDLTVFTSPADAKGRSHSAPSRSNSNSNSNAGASRQRVHVQRHLQRVIPRQNFVARNNFKAVQKFVPKFVAKGSANSPIAQQILARRNLPFLKANQAGPLKPRLGLPQNLQPKITLVKAPKVNLAPRFSPFMQRAWKHAFFWVAVAGIGYLTVPEAYYDRFMTYVDEDDPDYDSALSLLSLAALEEDEGVVRAPKPDTVSYRYSATTAAPKQIAIPKITQAQEQSTSEPSARSTETTTTATTSTCSLQPFVDRKWNQQFVWVQIPDVGSVTVPEDTYERFIGFVSSEPPNYANACMTLAEAAAADTVSPAIHASATN